MPLRRKSDTAGPPTVTFDESEDYGRPDSNSGRADIYRGCF